MQVSLAQRDAEVKEMDSLRDAAHRCAPPGTPNQPISRGTLYELV